QAMVKNSLLSLMTKKSKRIKPAGWATTPISLSLYFFFVERAMYLIDLINERQLKKTFTQLSAITQAISPNVQREHCSNFIGAIRYQLFGKMHEFTQLLTEPLEINIVEGEYHAFEFLREEWS